MIELPENDPQFAFDREERLNIFRRDAVAARFFKKAEYDKEASEGHTEIQFHPVTGMSMQVRHPGAGRPIYKETVFVEIGIPGSTIQQVCRPLRANDKMRFRPEWEAFEKNETEPRLGTPLSEIPFLTEVQRMEFIGSGCKTAEQLAAMSDGNGQKFMGFQQLRRRVQDYLKVAAGEAPVNEMRKELEQRDAQLAEMQKQIATLQAGAPAPAKRRGWPKGKPRKPAQAEAPPATE